jgi:hypothetical protein
MVGTPRAVVVVQAHCQHVVAIVETLLGAISRVDVPVDDRHPSGSADSDEAGRGDGDVVHVTVSVRLGRLGVVAARPHECVGHLSQTVLVSVSGRFEGRAGGVFRGVVGSLGDRGRGDEPAAALRGEISQGVEVRRVVDAFELIAGSGRHRPPGRVVGEFTFDHPADVFDPFGPVRVRFGDREPVVRRAIERAVGRAVFEEDRIVKDR